ncbi:MAG: hypothetical protein IT326_03775 [Anaerolineae bacterium]|nr:hypothetical protein [Anaerolineae bacterium]
MNQIAALHKAQTLDSRLDSMRTRLTDIEARLSQNRALQEAEAALAQASAVHHDLQARQVALEDERGALEEEGDEVEARLYSGTVHNPRELTEMQEKLAELRQRHARLEEPLLEVLTALEDSLAAVQQAEVTLESVHREVAITNAGLVVERDDLRAGIVPLEREVQQARSDLLPDTLAQYDKLRRAPGGVAVALLTEDESCRFCGVELTMQQVRQIRMGQVTACPTCGRLIVTI